MLCAAVVTGAVVLRYGGAVCVCATVVACAGDGGTVCFSDAGAEGAVGVCATVPAGASAAALRQL